MTGRAGRRRLAAVALAAGLVAAAAGGGGNVGASTDGSTADAASPDFDPEATINASYVVAPTNLDPHQSLHIGFENYWRATFDTLFSAYTGTPEPSLAEALEFSDDGLTATITLRDGVLFNDGTPVDASAVVASMERGKTLESSTAAARLEAIVDMEAVDDLTVQLTLDQPNPELAGLLSGPAGAVISPAAIESGRDLALEPGDAGSGPYVVTEFLPNDRVTYERSPNDYFQPEFQRLAGFTVQGISDYTTASNALQSGELDVAYLRLPVEEIDALEASGYTVGTYQAWGAQALFLRNTRNELGNPLVRQAIASAIDRDAVAEGLYSGACAVSGQIYPEGYPLHVDSYDPYPYDPDHARELLAEAGLDDGFAMEIHTSGNPESENMATIFQQYLGDIGIDVTVVPGTTADGNAAFARDEIDGRTTVAALSIDPLSHLNEFYLDGGRNHLLGPEADDVNALVEQARDPGISDEERTELYQEIGTAITDLALIAPVCFSDSYLVGDPSVINVDNNQFMWSGSFDYRAFAVATG